MVARACNLNPQAAKVSARPARDTKQDPVSKKKKVTKVPPRTAPKAVSGWSPAELERGGEAASLAGLPRGGAPRGRGSPGAGLPRDGPPQASILKGERILWLSRPRHSEL